MKADDVNTPDVPELLGLIADLVDPNPCGYDHHGDCQEHGWTCPDPPCPHRRAKEILAAYGFTISAP